MSTLQERGAPASAAQPGAPPSEPKFGKGRWLLGGAGLIVVALAASLAAVAWSRHVHAKELAEAASRAADSPSIVTVASVRRAPSTSELTLPGNAQAFRGAALYARTNGYIKRWLVDIGDRVTEGQLVAEISAPDVDDQLAQARESRPGQGQPADIGGQPRSGKSHVGPRHAGRAGHRHHVAPASTRTGPW